MEAFKVVKLIKKYEKCPCCGNDKVGNSEGGLIVEDNIFIRTCKCGFMVIINEDGQEINSLNLNKVEEYLKQKKFELNIENNSYNRGLVKGLEIALAIMKNNRE